MMRFISTWGTSCVSPEQKLFFYPIKPNRGFESKGMRNDTYHLPKILGPKSSKVQQF